MKDIGVSRLATAGAIVVASGVAGLFGYQLLRANIVEDVYRDRLQELSGQYHDLRATYNEAVKRTAVTELVVQDSKLSVRVRTAAGVERVIDTPFDPTGEIYVDYVVLDGRVWMRRVFDANTPPSNGVLVDPELASVDWQRDGAKFGKAVYRSLSEGRWVISVSGDGSLGIVRGGPEPAPLSAAPEVGDYDEMHNDLESRVSRIGAGEVLSRMFGG
ncbi:MAG: hypothetical protein R3B57_12975 [Phycisphaerales bacterium]